MNDTRTTWTCPHCWGEDPKALMPWRQEMGIQSCTVCNGEGVVYNEPTIVIENIPKDHVGPADWTDYKFAMSVTESALSEKDLDWEDE